MPLLKYLPHEICKPKQPKSLPHEICKPTPAIRIYPAAPHEFFIPKPTEKPATPPKSLTTIRARLWSQNPKKKKKKKIQIHNFTPTRSKIETKESWKPTIKAADPTNKMTPSHNPPPKRHQLCSHHVASRVPRSDSPALISTFECRWQSSPTSPTISSPSTPKLFRVCSVVSFSFTLFLFSQFRCLVLNLAYKTLVLYCSLSLLYYYIKKKHSSQVKQKLQEGPSALHVKTNSNKPNFHFHYTTHEAQFPHWLVAWPTVQWGPDC